MCNQYVNAMTYICARSAIFCLFVYGIIDNGTIEYRSRCMYLLTESVDCLRTYAYLIKRFLNNTIHTNFNLQTIVYY